MVYGTIALFNTLVVLSLTEVEDQVVCKKVCLMSHLNLIYLKYILFI